jgi:CRP/FNR family transcriptional regulator, cyclic AMP receptor protein
MVAAGRSGEAALYGTEDGGRSKRTTRQRNCGDCATRDRCLIGSLPQAATGLGPAVRERTFGKGEMLSRQGDKATHFRLVKLGTVFVCRGTATGAVRPVAIAGRGMVMGLCGYLRQPNQVSIVADTSGRCCELPLETIQSLASNDPNFRENLGKAYSDNFGLIARWAEAVGRRSVTAQVAASLQVLMDDQRSVNVIIPSHTALAQLLGTTRETVARSLAALEADGLLRRDGMRRCEVRPDALREWLGAQP